jgi:ergothioneine biosynthesis protein EgtB
MLTSFVPLPGTMYTVFNPAQEITDADAMRCAGRELLSLALIDSRNRTLRWLAAVEGLDASAARADFDPPWWTVGHAAWFQEAWIARQVQRGRGERCDPTAPRLASIDPRADETFDAQRSRRDQRWAHPALPGDELRAYLAATLETTLELLDASAVDDEALYFFRLALWHEDQVPEMLAGLAQAADLVSDRIKGLWPVWPSRARRDPIWFAAQHFRLGAERGGGFVPDSQKWAHDESALEFEIDAQPVQWSQFLEFILDGGYDEPRWWGREGWSWVQASARRAPRYVEQAGAAVLARRCGQLRRMGASHAVLHLSWHEADAWCRWAGRRLPTELEWELAAQQGAARGFVWGDVWEWAAGSARAWPGHTEGPARIDSVPPARTHRTLRGASCLTVPRVRHTKARRFAAATRDELFCGFRSCSV